MRSLAVARPVLVAALAAAACSSSSGTGSSAAGTGPTTSAITGDLNVFAAASLTGAFNRGKSGFTAPHPGLDVNYDFAGSNALATQIQQGAPADVFASADQANMHKLVTAGLVDTPRTFARNELEIAVAPGNPKHVTGLADLARAELSVVLEAPGVPAGDYTRQALSALHVTVTPKSLETDVKSAITKVTSGEADATVVYVTDVTAAGPAVAGVDIPDDENVVATYPIAVVKATPHRAAAEAFVTSATGGAIQQALRDAGFLAP